MIRCTTRRRAAAVGCSRGHHRRIWRNPLLLTSTGLLLLLLTGCLGSSSSNKGTAAIQTVTISPALSASIELGGIQQFTVLVKDNQGNTVTGVPVRYIVQNCPNNSCNTAPLSVSPSGTACGGSWDQSYTFCSPGVVGQALVSALVGGVTSEPTTVYVHQHIDSVQISPIGAPPYNCFSEGQTWRYQATAYGSGGVDITSTVGQMTWASASIGVANSSTTIANLQPNQVQITAASPGITHLTASVSGTTSDPFPYTTCLVSSVILGLSNGPGNTVTLSAGGSQTVDATILDTLGNPVSRAALTWGTSDPEIASVTSAGSVAGKQSVGAANIFAACAPPTCNLGIPLQTPGIPSLPIYSTGGTYPYGNPRAGQTAFGTISVNVTNSKTPTFTGWVATKDCYNLFNCSSFAFAVTPSSDPIGTAITLPRTPNSMMFDPTAARLYFGSDQGLMYLSSSSNPPAITLVSAVSSPCSVTLCGRVLAISDDGTRVVVSDTISSPNQVYIYSSASGAATQNLAVPGVTAAAFSPDETKIFLFSNTGALFVYSSADALGSVPVGPTVTGAAFAADGSFAYVAGAQPNAVSAFSTCALPGVVSTDLADVGTLTTPMTIVPLPDTQEVLNSTSPPTTTITQRVVALEQPANPQPTSVQVLKASFTRFPLLNQNQSTCNLPLFSQSGLALGFTALPSQNLGQGNFTPIYMRVANVTDGSAQLVMVGQGIPAVLLFTLDTAAGTIASTTAIPLLENGLPLAAAASSDGTQLYVATCTGNLQPDDQGNNRCFTPPNATPPGGMVHIINTLTGGDIQQVPFANNSTLNSMCINIDPVRYPCNPNLIAIKPQ